MEYNNRRDGWNQGGGWRDERGGGRSGRGRDRGRKGRGGEGDRGWRGSQRGGGRPWGRDRGRYNRNNDQEQYYNRPTYDDSEDRDVRDFKGRGGRGRGGVPRGLRGREIGLFFAARSKKNRERNERESRHYVQMDSNKEKHLSSLLATIRAGDEVPQQPKQSYRSLSDEEDESERVQHGNYTERDSYRTEEDTDRPQSYSTGCAARSTVTSSGATKIHWDSSDEDETEGAGSSAGASKNVKAECDTGKEVYWGDSSSSDDELLSQAAADLENNVLTEVEMKVETSAEDDEEEDVNDLYTFEEDENAGDFLLEFRLHNAANRNSTERINRTKQEEKFKEYKRNPELDDRLLEEMKSKEESDSLYKKMLSFRKNLPSYKMQNKIIEHINSNQVVVISGETGCGKTTQVTQFILDDYIKRGEGSMCRVVCTQPRRISAISVAERVADERADKCGGENSSAGYQIRLDNKLPRKQGSILYCTTGILLKWLTDDPYLSRATHVILDEIHERDILSDFLMIILKDLIEERRDLKVILMSATLNAEMFSEYFGGCPMLNIPGFTYPVKEYLLEDIVEMTEYYPEAIPMRKKRRLHGRKGREAHLEENKFKDFMYKMRDRYSRQTLDVVISMDDKEIDMNLCVHIIKHIMHDKGDGAILVFMPGWEQIKKLNDLLLKESGFKSDKALIIPLHSLMPTINQRQVFNRPPPGVRKIIIATNIAETSITIDDVVYVIDCGKIKMKNFDAENNLATLNPEPVSKANAKQRRGRAGRVQAGECYHLYTAYHESQFADYQLPEMLRTRLEELCLQIKMLKLGKIKPFVRKAMQPPPEMALDHAVQTLRDLNALDEYEDLTPLGYHLAKMPVDPHMGKMLLFGAMFSCLDPILTIAACLSFKDPFFIPLGREKEADKRRLVLSENSHSDHIMYANAFAGWQRAKSRGTDSQYCWDNFLSQQTLTMLAKMRNQFAELLYSMKFMPHKYTSREVNRNTGNLKLVKAIICAGLYPNVGKLVKIKKQKTSSHMLCTKTERKVYIHPKSVNDKESDFHSRWCVYHLKMKTVKLYLYDTTVVSPYPLLFFGGDICVRKDKGDQCAVVDDWIVFRAPKRTANIIKELRGEMDKLLAYKITHPGVSDWDPKGKEGAVMNAILDLIVTEETPRKNNYEY